MTNKKICRGDLFFKVFFSQSVLWVPFDYLFTYKMSRQTTKHIQCCIINISTFKALMKVVFHFILDMSYGFLILNWRLWPWWIGTGQKIIYTQIELELIELYSFCCSVFLIVKNYSNYYCLYCDKNYDVIVGVKKQPKILVTVCLIYITV